MIDKSLSQLLDNMTFPIYSSPNADSKEGTVFTWKVKEVAESRGIRSALQLADAADIAPGTATSYWYGRPTRIDFPTLGKLLKTLNCGLTDLIGYDPEKNDAPGLMPTAFAVAVQQSA